MNFIKKVLRHFGILGVERPHIIDQLCPLKNQDLAYLVLRNLEGTELYRLMRTSKLICKVVKKIEREIGMWWNVTTKNYKKILEKSGIHYMDVRLYREITYMGWMNVENLIIDFGRFKDDDIFTYISSCITKYFPKIHSLEMRNIRSIANCTFSDSQLKKLKMTSVDTITLNLYVPMQLSIKCPDLHIYHHCNVTFIGNKTNVLDAKKIVVKSCAQCVK